MGKSWACKALECVNGEGDIKLENFRIPYFFGYKTEIFSFQNSPKDLDPSPKTDLDLWDCLGRVKFVLLQNFI